MPTQHIIPQILINDPMNNIETLTLVDGHFTHQQAREVLLSLFQAKIHFHEMENFSSQRRFGHEDPMAVKRIPDLKKNMKSILDLVSQAAKGNKKMIVTSVIKIEFTDAE